MIAEKGIPDISLRAIARRMGMTAPALYRYFQSRDDLVTALALESMEALRLALEKARDTRPEDDIAGQLFETFMAWREWAMANPAGYFLFAGGPIPGYRIPWEKLDHASRRISFVFMELYAVAWKEELLTLPQEYSDLTSNYRQQLEDLKKRRGYEFPLELVHMMLYLWGLVHGLISFEIAGRMKPLIKHPCHVFRLQILAELKRFGLVPRDPSPCQET
jgi:AcrR family transcriptional regulator